MSEDKYPEPRMLIAECSLLSYVDDDDEPYPDDPFSVNEPGSVTFVVLNKYREHHEPYTTSTGEVLGKPYVTHHVEYEVQDYSGCACWAQEGTGLEYWLDQHIEPDELRVGGTYTVHGMRVTFFRGDGWEVDDDEEWEFDRLERHSAPLTCLRMNLLHLWHHGAIVPFRRLRERIAAKE